jgi:glycosyltransferase involved in cell wall biosynthesis
MRVGIDLFSLVPSEGRGAGFHRYVQGLISALGQVKHDHTFYVFVNRLNADMVPANGRFVRKVIPLPPQREVWPFRLLWQHTILPALARRHRLDLLHFPMDTASFTLAQPYVVTIHDLIADVFYPEHFPASLNRIKTRYLFEAKRRSARRARAVICPSEATARLACQHYGAPQERIRVIPEAADAKFFRDGEPRPKHDGPPYVLSVVSLSPHKNITTLVEAFARSRETHRLPHELRIVGMRGTDPRPIERHLAEQRRRGIPLRYLGFIEEQELQLAYAGADLFLYLSLVEGFGLPPLEAMASGVPVIASNTSSLPEVCDHAAFLVPPRDVQAAADAIGRMLTTPELAQRYIEAGQRRAAGFSWSETARQTVEVYQQAAGAVH